MDGHDNAGYGGPHGHGFDAMAGLFGSHATHAPGGHGHGHGAHATGHHGPGHGHGHGHGLGHGHGHGHGSHGMAHIEGHHELAHVHGVESAVGKCRSGFSMGYLAHALNSMGWCYGDTCEADVSMEGVRRVRLPGVVNFGRTHQSLIYPHGDCRPANMLSAIARSYGLVNIAFTSKDMDTEEKINQTLSDTTPFDGKARNTPMPSGWFPGASGFTRTFQQYWQIPKKKYFWSAPAADPTDKTYLICSGATWYYAETGDFETRLAITVHSLPFTECGYWKERTELIDAHLAVARKISEEFFARVKLVDPPQDSLIMRKFQAGREQTRLRAPHGNAGVLLNPEVALSETPVETAGPGPGPLRRKGSMTGSSDPITTADMAGTVR